MKTKSLKLALAMSVAALFAVACEPETITPAGTAEGINESVSNQTENMVGTMWKRSLYQDHSPHGFDMQTEAIWYLEFVADNQVRETFYFRAWGGGEYRDSVHQPNYYEYEFDGARNGNIYYTPDNATMFILEDQETLVTKPNGVSFKYQRVDHYDF